MHSQIEKTCMWHSCVNSLVRIIAMDKGQLTFTGAGGLSQSSYSCLHLEIVNNVHRHDFQTVSILFNHSLELSGDTYPVPLVLQQSKVCLDSVGPSFCAQLPPDHIHFQWCQRLRFLSQTPCAMLSILRTT